MKQILVAIICICSIVTNARCYPCFKTLEKNKGCSISANDRVGNDLFLKTTLADYSDFTTDTSDFSEKAPRPVFYQLGNPSIGDLFLEYELAPGPIIPIFLCLQNFRI